MLLSGPSKKVPNGSLARALTGAHCSMQAVLCPLDESCHLPYIFLSTDDPVFRQQKTPCQVSRLWPSPSLQLCLPHPFTGQGQGSPLHAQKRLSLSESDVPSSSCSFHHAFSSLLGVPLLTTTPHPILWPTALSGPVS